MVIKNHIKKLKPYQPPLEGRNPQKYMLLETWRAFFVLAVSMVGEELFEKTSGLSHGERAFDSFEELNVF